jgi:hypothetical protein
MSLNPDTKNTIQMIKCVLCTALEALTTRMPEPHDWPTPKPAGIPQLRLASVGVSIYSLGMQNSVFFPCNLMCAWESAYALYMYTFCKTVRHLIIETGGSSSTQTTKYKPFSFTLTQAGKQLRSIQSISPTCRHLMLPKKCRHLCYIPKDITIHEIKRDITIHPQKLARQCH